jgi:hypothetical protein
MSAKRYKLAELTSRQRIRRAMIKFKQMSKERRIELMVEAGVMTEEQAERAKKKLAENPA